MSTAIKGYIDAQWAIDSARQSGMKVDDFVESWLDGEGRHHRLTECGLGHTQKTIEWLLAQAVLPTDLQCVEIGPGTGRYHATLMRHRPDVKAMLYEANEGWRQYLQTRFAGAAVSMGECNGVGLASTPSESISLCSAHGVFVYLDTMISFGYLKEAVRCLKPGGYLFFDIMDFDRADIVELIESKMVDCPYMIPVSGLVVRSYLAKQGLHFVSTYTVGDERDMTSYLLFRKPELPE